MLSLTTTFFPAPTCFTPTSWYSWSTTGTSYDIQAVSKTQDCKAVCYTGSDNFFVALPTESSASCMPSGWSLDAIYSPGVCPKGYAVACSAMVSINTLVETIGTCCPEFFTCLGAIESSLFPASSGCRSRYGHIKYASQQNVISTNSLSTITLTVPNQSGGLVISSLTFKDGILQSTEQSVSGSSLTVAPKTISTTDSGGNSVVLTNVASGATLSATDARGTTFITTYTLGGGVVQSLVLQTSQLPDGQLATIASFAIVEIQSSTTSSALEFQTFSTVTQTNQLSDGYQATIISVLTNTNTGIPPRYSTYQAQYVYAYSVQIRFQSTSRSDVGRRRLAIGAKIGIGVAVPLLCFALLLRGFLIRKRRQRLTQAASQTDIDRKDYQSSYLKPELDADAEARRHELGDGARIPVELDDTSIMPALDAEDGSKPSKRTRRHGGLSYLSSRIQVKILF